MGVELARRLFTVHEYDQMAQAGILTEDDRVELLEGEIVHMTPIGSQHAACVARLTQRFADGLAGRAIIWVQNPIRLGEHSEPQPDLALLRSRSDFYAAAHPLPQDVLLLIEVADTSVETDRDVKIPLYARAGIPEVWLVDLPGYGVEVYRQPTPQAYRMIWRSERYDSLMPMAFSDLNLSVADMLGLV